MEDNIGTVTPEKIVDKNLLNEEMWIKVTRLIYIIFRKKIALIEAWNRQLIKWLLALCFLIVDGGISGDNGFSCDDGFDNDYGDSADKND